MGDVADDMVEGLCCSHCGTYFTEEHGYPVLCQDCYNDETEKERAGIQEALHDEV